MKIRIPHLAAAGTLTLVALVCGGCGGVPTGTVDGRVTLDGEPVGNGQVQFYDATRGIGVGASLGSNGDFLFTKPVEAGDYTVYVMPPPAPPPSLGGPPVEPPPPSEIPGKYHSADTSGLVVTVQEGKNSLEIELRR